MQDAPATFVQPWKQTRSFLVVAELPAALTPPLVTEGPSAGLWAGGGGPRGGTGGASAHLSDTQLYTPGNGLYRCKTVGKLKAG